MKKSKGMLPLVMAAAMFSSTASAVAIFGDDMYIDLGTNAYDAPGAAGDADTKTGIFTQFGFTQLLATSVYNTNDGTLLGDFRDTNDVSELTSLGLPILNATPIAGPGTPADPIPPVSLVLPGPDQVNIDGLEPAGNSEGYGATWEIVATYTLNGTLSPSGPSYTSGEIKFKFKNLPFGPAVPPIADGTDLFTMSVESSTVAVSPGSPVGALLLNMKITDAKPGFLFVDGIDVSTLINGGAGPFANAVLDTNVDPVFPTDDQLVAVQVNGDNFAIRQTTLDGSIGAAVPEPSSMLLLGLGLLGLGAARRKMAS